MSPRQESVERWREWVEKCTARLQELGAKETPESRGWLWREAFYDGYTIDEAIRIATTPEQNFRALRGSGWLIPRFK